MGHSLRAVLTASSRPKRSSMTFPLCGVGGSFSEPLIPRDGTPSSPASALTSMVQRTAFFALAADVRHVSIISRLSALDWRKRRSRANLRDWRWSSAAAPQPRSNQRTPHKATTPARPYRAADRARPRHVGHRHRSPRRSCRSPAPSSRRAGLFGMGQRALHLARAVSSRPRRSPARRDGVSRSRPWTH